MQCPSQPRSRRLLGVAARALVGLALVFATPHLAGAELTSSEFKEAQKECERIFSIRGMPREKAALLKRVAKDGKSRSYKLMADALVRECVILWDLRAAYQETVAKHSELLKNLMDGATKEEEKGSIELQDQVAKLETALRVEREVLKAVLAAVNEAPKALHDMLFRRAKTSKDWTYRAAAARLAAARLEDKTALSYLRTVLGKDKDRRVRSAALEAIAKQGEAAAPFAIERLADSAWSVQLQAVQMLVRLEHKAAIPHFINALSRTTPRVAEAIGTALKTMTGQNFEPYADVWSRWWEDNKDDFAGAPKVKGRAQERFEKVHFYGLPIKSDRVIFVIDLSKSMELPTKNANPAEKWKPQGPVTGDAPPPPPPPEEILSGPKIMVAKHELRKAVAKLPEQHYFTIIGFRTGVEAWKETPVQAKKANKEAAYKWIRKLKPKGVTYIEGALRRAFEIAGIVNVDDKYPVLVADTIVVMSDGAPTNNHPTKVKNADTEKLLALVRQWNHQDRVVIHAIGVDMLEHIDFLAKLAAQNGGTYVDR